MSAVPCLHENAIVSTELNVENMKLIRKNKLPSKGRHGSHCYRVLSRARMTDNIT